MDLTSALDVDEFSYNETN